MRPFLIPWLLTLTPLIKSQQLPDSFPHAHEGIPNTEYIYNSSNREQWQAYYRVNGTTLPNATECTMPSSYAGSIPVNRPGEANDTLFAWAIENTPGSLTNESSTAPWSIWLNGGPGSSSMIGLFLEASAFVIRLHSVIYLSDITSAWTMSSGEQLLSCSQSVCPTYFVGHVGVGFATASPTGSVADEDQMATDFMEFLTNLATIFPSLQKRPLYLIGESYAGTYIPYIAKAYFGMENPPVTLKHMVIGDGTMMATDPSNGISMVPFLETYPQLINYDIEVYKYFQQQAHLCGYDLNFTFPQKGPLPSVRPAFASEENFFASAARSSRQNMDLLRKLSKTATGLSKRDAVSAEERKRDFDRKVHDLKRGVLTEDQKYESRGLDRAWNKRASSADFSGRGNATTLDPYYECDLYAEVQDWALNFTQPWNTSGSPGDFDVYDATDALTPEAPMSDPSTLNTFLNDPRTVMAIHAPQTPWIASIAYTFNNSVDLLPGANVFGDTSPPPVLFLSELATNASQQGVGITMLSGQKDYILPTYGTLVVIQNFTFGGIQGFTQVPSSEWFADGKTAGIVHQERSLILGIFNNTGHLLAQGQPAAYKSFLKDFVLNQNKNGTLDASGKPVGVQNPLGHALNPAGENSPVFTGSGTTMGSTIWPSATIAAWDSALAQLLSTPTSISETKSGFMPLISTVPLKSLISLLVVGGVMTVY